MNVPPLHFTEADVDRLDFNCGPCALAACLGWTLERVGPVLGDFYRVGYLSVTEMQLCLERAGARYHPADPDGPWPVHGIIRIQFGGPWTGPAGNPRWAATHTHWVAAHRSGDRLWHVYDVNSGWVRAGAWAEGIAPKIAESIPRADGTWSATHRWEVRLPKEARRA